MDLQTHPYGCGCKSISSFSPWEVLLLCRIESLILCQKYQMPIWLSGIFTAILFL